LLPIVRGLINFCWFFFKWGTILGIIGAVVAVAYFYHQLNELIRSRTEAKLGAHYQGLSVSVRGAELIEGQGIVIYGLSIAEPGAEGPRAELLYIEELRLTCQTDLQELATKDPEVTAVRLVRPTIWATHRPDGTWSSGKLLPVPKYGEHPPEIVVEGGTIEIFDPLKSPTGTLTFRDVNLTLAASSSSEGAGLPPNLRRLQGRLSGDHIRQMAVEGLVDMHGPSWSISGTVEGVDVSPALCDSLPGALPEKAFVLRSVRGEAEFGFRLSYDPQSPTPSRVDACGQLTRGRIEDPRLPYPMTDVRATFRYDSQGWAIDELTGRSGSSTLRCSARQVATEAGRVLELTGDVRQVELDRPLLGVLPPAMKDLWYRYLPAGSVDVQGRVTYDGQTWRPEFEARTQNASFSYHKFPYRLDGCRGVLQMKDNVLSLNIAAQSGSQPIRLTAEVRNPLNGPSGWFEARGEELPLDEKLLMALPERNRSVVKSLNARGTCEFYYRVWRDQPTEPMHQRLVASVVRGELRFDKFPYKLNNVRGQLAMEDGRWMFRDFEGTNSTGRVNGAGNLVMGPQGSELSLHITGIDVPLEEELRDSLKPHLRDLWNDLRPRGTVDLDADVHFRPEDGQLDLALHAEPHSESTWIEPVCFPYRLEKLRGVLNYRDGHVTLERIKAEHGPVKLSAAGNCENQPDGSWRLQLKDMYVDRLSLDREFIQSLPSRLRRPLSELNVTGPINLRGTMEFQRGGRASDLLQVLWDVKVGIQRGSIDCGLKFDNLHGEVGLTGYFDGENLRSRGELSIDSLTYKDVQLSQVMGPLWIDDQQVLFGSWVDRPRSGAGQQPTGIPGNAERQPRSLSANTLGGTLYGDGSVILAALPRYQIQATLSQAELTRCAREMASSRHDVRGKVLATVDLHGAGRGIHGLNGHGTVRLREANVYQLPLMIAMLKLLSIREPDTNAFSQSDIDFRIAGNHVYFDPIDFRGDAISLLGDGEMNVETQRIQLTFHAMVGRAQLNLPVIKDLVGGASQQLMLIHVGGTLQDPQMRREALPAVNRALEMLRSPQSGESIRMAQ
jgi:hypothetical protein